MHLQISNENIVLMSESTQSITCRGSGFIKNLVFKIEIAMVGKYDIIVLTDIALARSLSAILSRLLARGETLSYWPVEQYFN